MPHTILLVQSSSRIETRTWSDYESTQDCMEAVCKMFEEHLKMHSPNSEYDISDLFKYIDRLTDICCLILNPNGNVYVPKAKDYIKEQIFILLRGQANLATA